MNHYLILPTTDLGVAERFNSGTDADATEYFKAWVKDNGHLKEFLLVRVLLRGQNAVEMITRIQTHEEYCANQP